ncbi:MAG: flagellar biosynthetic protein FliR [Pirellulales bacterium]
MASLLEQHLSELAIFALVLVRIGALVAVAPMFGSVAVPLQLRAVLALALAAVVTPFELDKATAVPPSLLAWLVLAGAEALVGLVLGLGVMVLFSALQVAGQIISQMSGMQLADAFDPSLGGNVPVFSQLFYYVTLAVFLAIGGHRHVLEALFDTFVWMPAGQGEYAPSVAAAMTSVLAQSFVLGIRAAAPVMVALLVATLILGLVARTLPQLNILALGFGANAMVAFVALSLSLGAAAWLFQDQLEPVLETLTDALKSRLGAVTAALDAAAAAR